METHVQEIIGYTFGQDRQAGSESRAYFVTAGTPEAAREAFEVFASELPLAGGCELDSISLDEEKGANGLYFGTISFRTPKIKARLADDIEELFGEKYGADRRSGSHERSFRVKAGTARAAFERLNSFIREHAETSGRLHINGITLDEGPDDGGWYQGRVSYANPSNKGNTDLVTGIVPAYGERITLTKDATTAERIFELRGFPNANAAKDALMAQYFEPGVEELSVEEDSGGAVQLYTGRIRYSNEGSGGSNGNNDDENPYPSSTQFEISASQQKVIRSRKTLGRYAANGQAAPDFKGLIGVTDQGVVEGVDLPVAESTFSETHYFPSALLTSSFIAFLSRAYGRVNSAPFRGFAAGEVQFIGASGSYRQGDEAVELSFRFAVSENESNIFVGNIGPIDKPGWAYLWVHYEDKIDETAKKLVKRPLAVYVEQVFQEMNFGMLGIG